MTDSIPGFFTKRKTSSEIGSLPFLFTLKLLSALRHRASTSLIGWLQHFSTLNSIISGNIELNRCRLQQTQIA